jgi:hypothetical protein
MNVKVSREIASIEKLEKKMVARTAKLRALIESSMQTPPRYANSPRYNLMNPVIKPEDEKKINAIQSGQNAPTPFKKTWGPGKAVPNKIKDEVKDYLREGFTGKEIRTHLNISLPTIQKIKKEIGLVKERSLFGGGK